MQALQIRLNARPRALWSNLCPVVQVLALLALFPGMLVVQFGMEVALKILPTDPTLKMPGLPLVGLGSVFLLGLVLILEFTYYPIENIVNCRSATALPRKYEAWETSLRPDSITLIEVLILQAIVIVLYALMLDGGLSFRGCLCSYLCYLAGVALVFARRGLAITKGDMIWIKWAWVPFITFGVPFFVSVSNGKWPTG